MNLRLAALIVGLIVASLLFGVKFTVSSQVEAVLPVHSVDVNTTILVYVLEDSRVSVWLVNEALFPARVSLLVGNHTVDLSVDAGDRLLVGPVRSSGDGVLPVVVIVHGQEGVNDPGFLSVGVGVSGGSMVRPLLVFFVLLMVVFGGGYLAVLGYLERRGMATISWPGIAFGSLGVLLLLASRSDSFSLGSAVLEPGQMCPLDSFEAGVQSIVGGLGRDIALIAVLSGSLVVAASVDYRYEYYVILVSKYYLKRLLLPLFLLQLMFIISIIAYFIAVFVAAGYAPLILKINSYDDIINASVPLASAYLSLVVASLSSGLLSLASRRSLVSGLLLALLILILGDSLFFAYYAGCLDILEYSVGYSGVVLSLVLLGAIAVVASRWRVR